MDRLDSASGVSLVDGTTKAVGARSSRHFEELTGIPIEWLGRGRVIEVCETLVVVQSLVAVLEGS